MLGGMAALVAMTLAPAASAAPGPTEATVYFVQMAPQDLELVVDGADVGTFPGRTAANFQFFETLVSAATHTFQMFPAGTGPTTGAPVVTTTATLAAGADYSLISYTDSSGSARLSVLPFLNDPLPAGSARLVVRNTAASGPVDIYVNGGRVAASLADDPATSPTADVVVPAQTVTVQATPAGNPSVVLASQVIPLSAGEVADLEVTGSSGSGGGAPSTVGLQGLFEYLPTGYWEVSRDGGVYAEGTAPFLGSLGGRRLTAPVVGISAAVSGRGYWLVAADGGIFTFGDAGFYGSAGAQHLAAPVTGMATTLDGGGYWLVAADGGVFSYGDADYLGSAGGQHVVAPVVGMTGTDDSHGYRLVGADGGMFDYGNSVYAGTPGMALTGPVVGVAAP